MHRRRHELCDPLAAHLVWRLPSSGGAEISGYKIYRGTAAGSETLLTESPDAKARFDDFTADPTVDKYTYKITAVYENPSADKIDAMAGLFMLYSRN